MSRLKHKPYLSKQARISLFLLLGCFAPSAWPLDIQVYAMFKDMVIVHIDGQQRKLRKDDVSPEGVKLVRANSEQAVLEYNGKQKSFTLGSHVSSSFPEVTRNEAMIWRQKGMYMSAGFINGQPVDFMVDTGASWIAMSSSQAQQLGINYIDQGEKGWASTANGVTSLYKVTLNRVKVGNIELRHVEASVLENSNPRYILLGNSFLNRVEMSREGQMMLLREK